MCLRDRLTSFGIISNEFIKNEDVEDEYLAVYTVLRTMLYGLSYDKTGIMTLPSLYKILNADSKNGSKAIAPIKDAIQWLVDNKYIELYDVLRNPKEYNSKTPSEDYVVNFLMEDEDNMINGGFTKIPLINLIKVSEHIISSTGIKKYKFIRYYITIARQCSNDENFGYISMKTLTSMLGISNKTCNDWNNVLKELGVIDFNNEYAKITRGTFKNDCTMFGHYNVINQYGDSLTTESFNDLVKSRVKSANLTKIDKENISNKKSIAAKKVWEERKKIINKNI